MPMFVFFVAVIAVVLVISFFYMVKAGAAMLVHVRRGTNCDDSATERFLELVSMMKNKGELVIHDDGTDTETTLYNDPRVVETLTARIREGAKVQCLFNADAETAVTKIAGIKAHILPAGAEWQSKVHFKIVDSGRAAYLSRHMPDGSREFQFMDCTGVPRTGRRLVSEYLKKFEDGVALANKDKGAPARA